MPKPLQRMSPLIWVLFLSYTFLIFTLGTDYLPFSPKPIVDEGPYDPHEDLSTIPTRLNVNITDTISREAILYIPKRIRRRAKRNVHLQVPAVVCFHGMGKTAMSAAVKDTEWTLIADRMGVLTIFPQSTGLHSAEQGDTKWHTGAEDFTYLSKLLKLVLTDLNIDLSMFFVTGLSNGAFFASDVLLHFQDVFAGGFIPQGGLGRLKPGQGKQEGGYKAPVFITVAEKDEWAPRSKAAATAYTAAKHAVKVVNIPNQGHEYASQYEKEAYRWLVQHRRQSSKSTDAVLQMLDRYSTFTSDQNT